MPSNNFCKIRNNISGFLWISSVILFIIGLIFFIVSLFGDMANLTKFNSTPYIIWYSSFASYIISNLITIDLPRSYRGHIECNN